MHNSPSHLEEMDFDGLGFGNEEYEDSDALVPCKDQHLVEDDEMREYHLYGGFWKPNR